MTKILIVTGGSGGHVIPALTIFDHLKYNFDVRIATDERGTKFINKQDYEYNLFKVPNLFSNIWSLPFKLFKFIYVMFESYNYLKKNNISKIINDKTKNLTLLKNDTNNIIIFNDGFSNKIKKNKPRSFWNLLKSE